LIAGDDIVDVDLVSTMVMGLEPFDMPLFRYLSNKVPDFNVIDFDWDRRKKYELHPGWRR
jgi:hypothetical protein